jgi:uncharacterized protein YndB with AHSA1/START domain
MDDRVLELTAEVDATPAEVFALWTTPDGVVKFFPAAAKIELKPGGAYEMYFDLEAPEGERGSEGCTVIEFEEGRHLAFTWNFPPNLPAIRHEHTRVDLTLTPLGPRRSRVVLLQTGWRCGHDWNAGYDYFDKAWRWVLGNLTAHCAKRADAT